MAPIKNKFFITFTVVRGGGVLFFWKDHIVIKDLTTFRLHQHVKNNNVKRLTLSLANENRWFDHEFLWRALEFAKQENDVVWPIAVVTCHQRKPLLNHIEQNEPAGENDCCHSDTMFLRSKDFLSNHLRMFLATCHRVNVKNSDRNNRSSNHHYLAIALLLIGVSPSLVVVISRLLSSLCVL